MSGTTLRRPAGSRAPQRSTRWSTPQWIQRWRRRAAALTLTLISLLVAAPAYAAAPDPGQTQPPGTQGLNTMLDWGGWGVSFAGVSGILVVASIMALRHRRGEAGETMGSLGWVLGACVLGTAAGPLANALT